MTIDVKIIEDSISDAGARITTFQLKVPEDAPYKTQHD